MKLLKLRWSNFKSFQGEHELDFSALGPGLIFLRGENQDEPTIGANGAGKSSVWDVLHWCLFGTSLRGVKTPQLVPWSKSGKPVAELILKIDGKRTIIRRKYRPNLITVVRGKRETNVKQDQLEDLLGLTSDTFQSSVVIGQFSNMFFDLKPRDKLLLFTDLLDLDYWLECSGRASETLRRIRRLSVKARSTLDGLKGARRQLITTVDDLRSQAPSGHDLSMLRRKLKAVTRRKIKVGATLANTYLERDHHYVEAKDARNVVGDSQGEIDVLRSAAQSLVESTENNRAVIKVYKDHLYDLENACGNCPSCGQPITEKHLTKERRDVRNRIKPLLKEIKGYKKDYSKLKRKLSEASGILEGARLEFKHSTAAADEYDLEIRNCSHMVRDINDMVLDLDHQISKADDKVNLYTKQLRKYSIELKRIKSKISKTKKKLNQHEADAGNVGYWVNAFKDVRLFEIEEALQSLQVEINSYLADLGMEAWSVRLEIEHETKSGSVSKGFRVMVDPGTGTDDVKPWEAWSGGEGQRLRLAGTMALSNLILQQFDTECDVQVWDEKLYWLSGSGEDDMLDLLSEIARKQDKQIWLVDQHNLDYPFDNVVTVVKDENGSRIQL